MAYGALSTVLRHIHQIIGVSGVGRCTDRQLLDQFVRSRDEAAFAVLVERHGPMVYGMRFPIVKE